MFSRVLGWDYDARTNQLRVASSFVMSFVYGLLMLYLVSLAFGTDDKALWFGMVESMPLVPLTTFFLSPLKCTGLNRNSIIYTILILLAGVGGSATVFLAASFILGSLR